ncbi:competence/damage-inducible protein A [Fontivita pretiosa]|uniref:competence/damage-inducible protein A n=1 Tax=Fontivita pretiosa TaxID=2989684 RepID=UPI003D17299C
MTCEHLSTLISTSDRTMNAIILSVGDELILGQNVDTNSAWISRQLAAVGCPVSAHVTVGDNQRAIEQAIYESGERADFLIITGGIGPTPDDLTRQALAVVMRQELQLNELWAKRLEEYFQARGRSMPQSNRIQAMIPTGARMIENTMGTAAGIDATLTFDLSVPGHSPRKHTCRVFVLPGVPKEMMAMFTRDVLPHIRQATGGACILSRSLHTFGLGESAVAEKLGALMDRGRNPSVGTTVSGGVVTIRINAAFASREKAEQELEATVAACREILGDLIYGEDDETLEQVVGRMLAERRLAVTTAESCTGGLLAKMITDVPGASEYFHVGFITYSNQMKYERLGVSLEIIHLYGAVSEPVVSAMANNAKRLAKANVALAISGVAGPGGGTPAKPVGTVCIALAHDAGTTARTFNFPGDRQWIRDRAAKMALTMLRYHLLGKQMPF